MLYSSLFVLIYHGGEEKLDVSFPDGFLIGAASSSYQIEGAWNHGGKIIQYS